MGVWERVETELYGAERGTVESLLGTLDRTVYTGDWKRVPWIQSTKCTNRSQSVGQQARRRDSRSNDSQPRRGERRTLRTRNQSSATLVLFYTIKKSEEVAPIF